VLVIAVGVKAWLDKRAGPRRSLELDAMLTEKLAPVHQQLRDLTAHVIGPDGENGIRGDVREMKRRSTDSRSASASASKPVTLARSGGPHEARVGVPVRVHLHRDGARATRARSPRAAAPSIALVYVSVGLLVGAVALAAPASLQQALGIVAPYLPAKFRTAPSAQPQVLAAPEVHDDRP
jgi:hypothetical protein